MVLVVVFAANIVSKTFTPAEMLPLIFVPVMASVSLPLEVIGLIAGIDVVLDTMRTM